LPSITPASIASQARSKLDRGIPRVAGSSQAIAMICARWTAPKRLGAARAACIRQPGPAGSGQDDPGPQQHPSLPGGTGQRQQGCMLLGRQHELDGLDGGTGTFCQNGHPGAGSDIPPAWGRIEAVPKPPPESTKTSLRQRLTSHAKAHWPDLAAVNVRYRGMFAHIDGQLPIGITLPLCRLRYNGSASSGGFAFYLASRDGYENSILPSGLHAGSPEEALGCACGLYLNAPTAWLQPPTS
jgi:hypothetical protein